MRGLLVEKYGKEFAVHAGEGKGVAERVLKKLRVDAPGEELVTLYLREIARTYGIEWPRGINEETGPPDGDDEDEDGGGTAEKIKAPEEPLATNELTNAVTPRDIGPKSPVSVAPPRATSDNISPKIKLPAPPELKPGAAMKKSTSGTKAESEANGETKGSGGGGGNGGKSAGGAVGGKIPNVDELAKRFAALKK